MANPQVVVDFVANTRDLQAANREVGTGAAKAGALLKRGFAPAVATLGAVAIGARKTIDAASALNEQIAASGQVFGKQSKVMQEWAKTGAEAFGLSQTEALKAANAYGNMFNTVGLGTKQTAAMSRAMVQLAGDMASFHDQDPTEMLEKLQSGLSGEAEPLRKFGVLISDAAVKQKAYQEGIAKTGAELTEGQKVQARYALIMDQTAKAQGDFARTSDSVANRQRTLNAQNENAAATIGQDLLPATRTFMGILSKLIGVIASNKTVLQGTVVVVTALAAAVVAANAGMAVYRATTVLITAASKAWAAAQWLVNAAMTANPIGAVIVAVAALVAGLVVAYKTSDKFRAIVDKAFKTVLNVAKNLFGWIKSHWPLLVSIIGGPIAAVAVQVIRNWDRIKSGTQAAWNAIRNAVRTIVESIRNILNNLREWMAGTFLAAVRSITTRVGNAFDAIVRGARSAFNAVKGVLNSMVGWISNLVGRVANAVGRIANAIKNPINSVLRAWNSISLSVPRISLPSTKILGKRIGGGSFGGWTINFPDVPLLARGGVVSQPTLAMLGEGVGREIVTPESLLREIVGAQSIEVRVFIGDTELTDLVRTEIVTADNQVARTLLAGAGTT